MFLKSVLKSSISTKVVAIYALSILMILGTITWLIYPPLRELLQHSIPDNLDKTYVLTQICLKKLFIGLWVSALISIAMSYFIVKLSISPIKKFSQELNSVHAGALDNRLPSATYPKELRELAITNNQMLARIEKSFNNVKSFTACMAHEFKNPLHYLRTATEVALKKPQSTDEYQSLLYSHLEEYQNLSQMIDNLLFLARSENKQEPLKVESISLQPLIESLMEYFQVVAIDKNIQLRLTGDAEVYGDTILLKRVLANLIDNSLNYTPEGGEINISIYTEKNTHAVIDVKDTGIGIPASKIPLVFNHYYQVNNQSEHSSNHLGLGLAICHSIVTNLQGSIQIDSQENLGTCVTVKLPLDFKVQTG